MRVYSIETGGKIAERAVLLRSSNPCRRNEPCASDDPASATLDLLTTFPEIAAQKRVRVEVTLGSRLWAFVTVTNNQTQHVTVISPQ